MRRALRHGRLLGFEGPFFFKTTESVVRLMGSAYPELNDRKDYLAEVVRNEEERFSDTLGKGLGLLEHEIASLRKSGQTRLAGEVAFRLYDTYGFPLDLTEDFLSSEGLSLDHAGFDRAMEEQRTRAREGQKGTVYISANLTDLRSRFVGDRIIEWESEILATLVHGETRTDTIREGEEVEIVTAETPFYGESGGQVGDTGRLETARGDLVEISDTQKPQPSLIVHRGRVSRGAIQVGDRVRLVIDSARREATRLNHSATHILHSALREILGPHVRQAGSLVTPERLRFDFTHTSPVKDDILQRIEDLVNVHVRENAEVTSQEMTLNDALKSGALAFFGEKYGERVRVLRMGDFSTELCGGTHVNRTGDIGVFKLKAEAGVASGVRRVEAMTGEGALEWIRQRDQILKEISQLLKGSEEEVADKLERLMAQQRELEKKIIQLQSTLVSAQGEDILSQARKLNGVSVIASRVEGVDDKGLRELADRLRDKLQPAVIVLGSTQGDRVALLAAVSKDAVKKYHAGNIIKQIAPIVGGGGGGRPDFAQAGGKDSSRLEEALQKVYELIEKGT
jgi:alanyl-tRNA synthetase